MNWSVIWHSVWTLWVGLSLFYLIFWRQKTEDRIAELEATVDELMDEKEEK
jgi:hypothetical protein